MLRSLAIWLAFGCAALPTSGLALPTLPDARREIQEALHRSDVSIHQKDIQGCMVVFTQDFHGQSINGERFDRKVAKQSLIKSLSYANSVTAHTLMKSFTLVNGQAIVVSQEHTTLTILGRRTHRLHSLVFDGLWQSIWIDTKAGWREQSEKQLTSTVTKDGVAKVVMPTRAK